MNQKPIRIFLDEHDTLAIRLPWRMRGLLKRHVDATDRRWVRIEGGGYWRVTVRGYHAFVGDGSAWYLAPIPDDVLAYVQRIDDASTRLEAGVE